MSYTRPPGNHTPSTTSSSYFTANDHLSNYSLSSTSSPFYSSTTLGHGPPPPSTSPFFHPATHSSPEISFKSLDSIAARPYPPIERRTLRDVSSSGDMIVNSPRSEDTAGWGGVDATGAGAGAGVGGSSSATRGRSTPTTNAAGAIGDGRKVSGAIGGERKAVGSGDEQQLGLTGLGALFDGRSALGFGNAFANTGALSPGGGAAEDGASTPSKSRPSSFILDVLPSRTGDRNGAVTSSSASLSIDTASSTATTATTSARSGTSPGTSPLPSPSLTVDPRPTSILPDSTLLHHSPTSNSAPLPPDSLTTRMNSLESTVADLSTLLSSEVRSLREEVGVLRGLVLQGAAGSTGAGRANPMVRQQSHDEGGGGGTDSPLLTLRSPSPPRSSAIASALPLSTSAPNPASPMLGNGNGSGNGNSGGGRPQWPPQAYPNAANGAPEEMDKDEQIRLLTAQVNALSSSVAQFNVGGGGGVGGQFQRGGSAMGLGMSIGGGTPKSSMMRPSLSAGGIGGLGGGAGGIALSRTGSLGGVGGAFRRGGSGESFDPLSSPAASGWGDTASPLLGSAGPGSAAAAGLSSPSLGGGGAGANPPGSLGGKWEALGVGNELFRTIAKYGLGPPTKIQSKAIPCILRNQDIVTQAPSIQERIQAYVVPALQLVVSTLAANPSSSAAIQILIVTATVDQAAQAQRLSVGMGGQLGIRTSLVVGSSSGADLQAEAQQLVQAPPHVLVGTPAKLLDLLALRLVHLGEVKLLVVDECDQLIARNLSEFVGNLVRLLPPSVAVGGGGGGGTPGSPIMTRSPMLGGGGIGLPGAFDTPVIGSGGGGGGGRQTAILSCTVPQDVLNFASSLQLREPVRVLVRREGGDSTSPTVRNLKQYYVYIAVGSSTKSKAVGVGRREASNAREWKLEALADLCEDYAFDNAVIFCSSVDAVEAVSYKLGTRAIETLALHQDMGQSARHNIMTKFRSPHRSATGGSKKVLVVYDALCRTLTDVPQVPLVINYDLPRAVEDYVHRITCATASGYARPGVAINIVTPGADVEMLRAIEAFYRCKIAELPPTFSS